MEEEREAAQEEEVVYREVIRFRGWLLFFLLGLMILYIALFVTFLIKGNKLASIIFLIVTIFMVLVFLNFWTLVFEITDTRVKVRFGVVHKSVSRTDIKSCEPYELTFGNYMGFGIRYGVFDGTKAYNTRNGSGIKMVVEGEDRPLVVSVDDPGKVCSLLSAQEKRISDFDGK